MLFLGHDALFRASGLIMVHLWNSLFICGTLFTKKNIILDENFGKKTNNSVILRMNNTLFCKQSKNLLCFQEKYEDNGKETSDFIVIVLISFSLFYYIYVIVLVDFLAPFESVLYKFSWIFPDNFLIHHTEDTTKKFLFITKIL